MQVTHFCETGTDPEISSKIPHILFLKQYNGITIIFFSTQNNRTVLQLQKRKKKTARPRWLNVMMSEVNHRV